MPPPLTCVMRPWLLAALASLPAQAWPAASLLYNPALGSLPTAQGWAILAAGQPAAVALDNGSLRLDTTGAGVSSFGFGRISPVALDTQAGFDLHWRLQLLSEAHTSPNRSGYTLLMVGAQPGRALELAFWTDHVWAQDHDAGHPDRFVHGADAAFDTTMATDYTLSVRQQQFTLSAGGATLLTGALRDYTAAGLPYTLPNFVFLGDNSARGASVSRLGAVSLSPVPEPAPALLLALGLAALALRRR